MTFNDWWHKLNKVPWQFRIVLFIELLRPIIDNFYYLKDISPLLSPLNWAGVISTLACILVIFNNRRKGRYRLDTYFTVFGLLVFLSSIFILIKSGILSIDSWQAFLKLIFPILLYFFYRGLIGSQADFELVAKTYLYACLLSFGLLIYEMIFGGIRVEYTRGSVERIQANYADILNYSGYLLISIILISYEYLKNPKNKKQLRNWIFIVVFVVMGLLKINHVTSFITFIGLVVVFLLFIIKHRGGIVFILFTLVIIFFSLGILEDIYYENLNPLIEEDLQVLSGERGEENLFHGRFTRWQFILKGFSESTIVAKLVGYPWMFGDRNEYFTFGPHNDFIRILMLTGILGLSTYLLILRKLLVKKTVFQYQRFLFTSSVLFIVIISITTVPTLYPNILYFIMAIMAYSALPRYRM